MKNKPKYAEAKTRATVPGTFEEFRAGIRRAGEKGRERRQYAKIAAREKESGVSILEEEFGG